MNEFTTVHDTGLAAGESIKDCCHWAGIAELERERDHWHRTFNRIKESNDRIRAELTTLSPIALDHRGNPRVAELEDELIELEKQLAACRGNPLSSNPNAKSHAERIEAQSKRIKELESELATAKAKHATRIREMQDELDYAKECVETCRLIEEHKIFIEYEDEDVDLKDIPEWWTGKYNSEDWHTADTLHAAVRMASEGGKE